MTQWIINCWKYVIMPAAGMVLAGSLLFFADTMRIHDRLLDTHSHHIEEEHGFFENLNRWRNDVDLQLGSISHNLWVFCRNQRKVLTRFKVHLDDLPICIEPQTRPRFDDLLPQRRDQAIELLGEWKPPTVKVPPLFEDTEDKVLWRR